VAADPFVRPASRQAWRRWLERHHTTSRGVWVHFAKKHTNVTTVGYTDAVEEALCFGWVDGLARPVDDVYYQQRFTPRKPGSTWAATNKARVEKLIAAGLMTAAGLAAIAIARANGSWDRLTAVDAGVVPGDLARALKKTAGARTAFDALTPGKRKQFLYYLNDAKKPETRARRIAYVLSELSASTTKRTKGTKRTGGLRPPPEGRRRRA
jgi:uncharacterized protein YdeI (YjbR/CyaY-like superfamily)